MNMALWKRTLLAVRTTLALSLAVMGAAGAGDVVISQVYGGGGASGAPYKSDFIELHNKGASDVALDGWSIQYASGNATSAQTSWSVNPATGLTGTIKAGGYYLIQMGTSGSVGADLPTPDASSTGSNIGTTAGKVALLNTTTKIAAVTCPSADPAVAGNVQDFVGYGPSANCWDGTAAAPAPSGTTQAALRKGTPRGAIDTDNNSSDFETGAPDPRNSAFTGAPSVTSVTFDPVTVPPGGSTTISASVVVGTSPISTVTADLTPVGGSATAALTYDAGAKAWKATFTVSASTPTGAKTITVTATDTGAKTASAGGLLSVSTGVPFNVRDARQQPLGSTFKVRGIVTATSPGNAYIQDADSVANGGGLLLFDGSTISGVEPLVLGDDVTLDGRLDIFANELEFVVTDYATDPSKYTINSSGNPLPAIKTLTLTDVTGNDLYESQLVRFTDLKAVGVPGTISPTGNSTSFNVEDPAGKRISVYLHRNTTTGATAPYPGPPAAPYTPIPATVAGDNSITFPDIKVGDIFTMAGPLAERTTADPFKVIRLRFAEDLVLTGRALVTGTGAAPAQVERGGVVTLSVTTDPAAGSSVTADLSSLGGSATQSLSYNGTNYTFDFTVPAGAPLGPATVPVLATNGTVNDKGQIALTVITQKQTMTIAQVRAAADYTQAEITGKITAATIGTAKSYQIEDATGGLFLFTTGIDLGANVGDVYTISGVKQLFNGAVELVYTNGTWSYQSTESVTPGTTKEFEWPAKAGRLLTNSSLYVVSQLTGVGTGNNAYIVTDGTAFGEMFIHTRAGFAPGDLPVVGQSYTVTGVVDYMVSGTRDTHQIKPRQPSDVTAGTPPAQIPTQMAFTVQPPNGAPGAPLAPAPAVTVRDAGGATVTAFVGPVKVALTTPGSATLSGTTTVNAASGIAAFPGLSVDVAGTYTLTASSLGLANAVSASFTVAAAQVPFLTEDVKTALRLAAGIAAAQPADVARFDLNGDGRVTLVDASVVNRKVNGIGSNP